MRLRKYGYNPTVCYKIASFENTDLNLIRKVAATGKPLIVSTGMMDLSEMDEMVRNAREAGCKDLILLKCTSTYPSTPKGTNISTIPHMREMFGCEIGLSDHSMGIEVSVASVAMGATVIEKHFTTNQDLPGRDNKFAVMPEQFSQLVRYCNEAVSAFTDRGINAQSIEADTIENYRGRWG